MGVGRRAGVLFPLDFENYSEKGCFFSFELEKKQISPLLAPLTKFLEESPSGSPGKNPSDPHERM